MQEYVDAVHCLVGVLKHQQHLDDLLGERRYGRRQGQPGSRPGHSSTREKTPGRAVRNRSRLDSGTAQGPLTQQICYGVARQYYSLNDLLDQLLVKPLPPGQLDLKVLLLAGLYSVIELKRPVHTSVNAAVEAVMRLRKPWAKGLVNGVLRHYLRDRDRLDARRLESADEFSEARLNHPGWLIEAFSTAWPELTRPVADNAAHANIFLAGNTQAPCTLRVNRRKITRSAYAGLLTKQRIPHTIGKLVNTAITLHQAMPVADLPGFRAGLVSIQDEAPQLAATLLNLQPGLRVLDACAAPGGKTCHILEQEPAIKLTAIDRSQGRTIRIRENLERLGLSCETSACEVITAALENYNPGELFDRILLDAPCSGTGIIRRHPDIKLLRKKSDVGKLRAIQYILLNRAFDLLKPGGELLYSTCSILPDENDHLVRELLATRMDARSLHLDIDTKASSSSRTETGVQLFPTLDQHDGFFYSRISKLDANVTKPAPAKQTPLP